MGGSIVDTDLPTVIGACAAAINSNLDLSTVSIAVSVTGNASYDDPSIPISQTVAIAGTLEKTWNRVSLPPVGNEIAEPPSPGDGNFYLIQYACACCRCRYAFAFDEGNVPVPENNGEGIAIGPSFDYSTGAPINVNVPISVTDSSGFDTPPADPPDYGIAVCLWNHNAPPCRKADGPATLWPYFVYVSLGFGPDYPPFENTVGPNLDTSFTISGTDGAEVISDLDSPGGVIGSGFWVRFDAVDACELAHTYSLGFTYHVEYSNEDASATQVYDSTITVDFNIGS